MRFLPTDLPGVVLVEPRVWPDARGFFLETYHAEKFRAAGLTRPFVQDNHSQSVHRTLRGLHLQLREPQGKLVRVVEGAIFDVAVDVRRGSPTFGRSVWTTLSAENHALLYVAPGLAHGFAVLTPVAQVEYKCTAVYSPSSELGIAWDDPALGIPWPIDDPILSERDRGHRHLRDLVGELPAWDPATLL